MGKFTLVTHKYIQVYSEKNTGTQCDEDGQETKRHGETGR